MLSFCFLFRYPPLGELSTAVTVGESMCTERERERVGGEVGGGGKNNALYCDETQHENFRGKLLFQAAKQHLNNT